MLLLSEVKLLSLFTLLSHEKPLEGQFTKKRDLLVRLSLWSLQSGFADVPVISPLTLLVFRIAHFSRDDLLVSQHLSLEALLAYKNPCNSRRAFKALCAAVPACTAELNDRFGSELFSPKGSTNSTEIVDSQLFPSLSVTAPKVLLTRGSCEYALVANEKFESGDVVVSLSPDLAISLLSVFRDEGFPGRDMFEQGMHPDIIFMLYLIHLRDRYQMTSLTTVHSDFFRIQPTTYGTLFELPIEVVEALGEPELTATVISQNETLESIATSLQPSPAFADLLWAKSLCTSRGFSLPIQPKSELEQNIVADYYPDGKITTILPIVHFLNHDFNAQCDTPVVDPVTGAVQLIAVGKIAKGDEIFVLYGGMNNREFMLNYGFFVPGNPYDQIVKDDGSLVRRGALAEAKITDPTPLGEAWETEYAQFRTLVNGYRRAKFLV